MSSILDKPFSWANKIVKAVFKGSPNLITTSDLNRQIEALKKEMYVLQQSSGVVISDFVASKVETENYVPYAHSESSNVVNTSGTYVFCNGVRFDLNLVGSYQITGVKELRLYARKELVAYEDDFTKEISGAKFSDNTTFPAANHYVYREAKVELVDASLPNSEFEFAQSSGYDYICTLFRAEYRSSPAASGYYPYNIYVQVFTTPMGKGLLDVKDKYGKFIQYTPVGKSEAMFSFVPNADDDWKDIANKLWSRLYSLERRLFMESRFGAGGISAWVSINGVEFTEFHRNFSKTYTSDANFGSIYIRYRYRLVGNICFVHGSLDIEKNLYAAPLSTMLSLTIGTTENEMPIAVYSGYGFPIILQNGLTEPDVPTTLKGYIDMDKFRFSGIPVGGVDVTWSAIYCFSSEHFWDISPDDRSLYFNDIR